MKKKCLLMLLPLLLTSCQKPINPADYSIEDFAVFKQMVDTTEYFEFNSENSINPSISLDYDAGYTFYHAGQYNYEHDIVNKRFGYQKYNIDYLKYFSDSMFYPTYFPDNAPNISDRRLEISSDAYDSSEEKLSKQEMVLFYIDLNPIDYFHTTQTNELISLSFSAKSLNYSEGHDSCSYYHDRYNLEDFKEYETNLFKFKYIITIAYMGETAIGVKILGHFRHNNYCYHLGSTIKV